MSCISLLSSSKYFWSYIFEWKYVDLKFREKTSRILSTLDSLASESRRYEINNSKRLKELKDELLKFLEQTKPTSTPDNLLSDISVKCSNILETGKELVVSQQVTKSLHFKSIQERKIDVKEAHAQTFEWMFNGAEPRSDSKDRGFAKWLESGTGVYWIAGKAGSGKSTLMKWLIDQERTRSALTGWASDEYLILAHHFFWNAGTHMQKSLNGLLQSLLFQILRQCPALIPAICSPKRLLYSDENHLGFSQWSSKELFDTFELFSRQRVVSCKVCCFVDGLDEYDGEHFDVIKTLKSWIKSGNIKICISSRPWNVFEQAFSWNVNQKLLLQDLTREDIELYVKQRLEEHQSFSRLIERDSRYLDLIRGVVDKAQGVFLWVYLVVRSLRRGLTNEDDIMTLQRRLDELPSDLEEYFKKMLTAIDNVYREETAQIFLVTLHATSPLPVMAFDFMKEGMKDPNYAIHANVKSMSQVVVDEANKKTKTYLNARCKDLLEINRSTGHNFLKYKVDYLHRTVRDFLQNKELQNLLQHQAGDEFDARLTLCRVHLALVKSYQHKIRSKFWRTSLGWLMDIVRDLLEYAHQVETCDKKSQIALLDELYRTLLIHCGGRLLNPYRFSNLSGNVAIDLKVPTNEDNLETFVKIAMEARLPLYVAHTLECRPLLSEKSERGAPLLHHALQLFLRGSKGLKNPKEPNLDSEMVRMLLFQQSDPNQLVEEGGNTIWGFYLRYLCGLSNAERQQRLTEYFEMAELLLQHGANPNLSCTTLIKSQANDMSYGGDQHDKNEIIVIGTPYPTSSELLKAIFKPYQFSQLMSTVPRNQQAHIDCQYPHIPGRRILSWFKWRSYAHAFMDLNHIGIPGIKSNIGQRRENPVLDILVPSVGGEEEYVFVVN